ncbi:kinase-like domain-containing protein [Choanephora cucurbitarum]|nr:kinase-like domain-containing protein [Choanephora cucurbitarum]
MSIRQAPFLDTYELLEQIGNGSFAVVYKGKKRDSNELVAIKAMKKKISPSHRKECKALEQLAPHPNIIQLFDVCHQTQSFLVMEYMNSGDLYQLLETRRQAGERFHLKEIRSILTQVLAAFHHMHHIQGLFHRDIKPENLLIHQTQDDMVVKLADFGLATEIKSKRVAEDDYVSTRWYRAPEVLLKSTDYSFPIDLWALGTIFAELISLRPLFPGQSEEDQLMRISRLLGHPDLSYRKTSRRHRLYHHRSMPCLPEPVVTQLGLGGFWREGALLAQKIGFEFPQTPSEPDALAQCLKPYCISTEAEDLLLKLLQYDPKKRITSTEALQHPFFLDDTVHSPTFQSFSPTVQLPKIPLSPINLEPSISSSCSLHPRDDSHVHTYFESPSSFARTTSMPDFQLPQQQEPVLIPLQDAPKRLLKTPFQRLHRWTKRYISNDEQYSQNHHTK